jgi:excinuclease UvrABC ATPase subunit
MRKNSRNTTWMMQAIQIRGAQVHNLKNIDVDIPHNQLVW